MKKCLLIKVVGIVAFFPLLAFAGFQVANSDQSSTDPTQLSFFQADSSHTVYGRDQFKNLGAPQELYAIRVSGSLKENIERIMGVGPSPWKVIWKSPYDYNFDGSVKGRDLPDVMQKLLQPFPLTATLYMANKVMVIKPKNTIQSQDQNVGNG